MIGELVTSFILELLELLIYPVLYDLWKKKKLEEVGSFVENGHKGCR